MPAPSDQPTLIVRRAEPDERDVFANLLELYAYDDSAIVGSDVGPSGRYGYCWLDSYWTEPGRVPFLIEVNGRLAGFVLVRRVSSEAGDPPRHSIAEFFVLRKYRRRGVGSRVAREVFERLPGEWHVDVFISPRARSFWQRLMERLDPPQLRKLAGSDPVYHAYRYVFRWPPP